MSYDLTKTGVEIDAIHQKVDGIEAGAEVNNISDVNASDLTDAGETALHSHANDHAELHTVVSHSDTTATGSQLNTLVGGGQTTLHSHETDLITHIVKAATATLTAAECTSTIIENYGQSAANTLTLPAAAVGLNFIAQVFTIGQGAFNIKAGTGDKIYFDGTALDDGDKVSCATPVVGNFITFWVIKSGASTYDWMAASGQGTWTDGGA